MSKTATDGLTTSDMFALDQACTLIRKAFGPPYLVGSAGFGGSGEYRDVDVRLILTDDEFDGMFPNDSVGRARWELLSVAIGDYLRRATALPIDFQIQRQTEANEKHDKPRNPLGMSRNFAGLGDATPFLRREG